MGNKVYFLMAIHFHQPIGNFNFVFEKVCSNSYQPFIETLKEFPDIKLTIHITGCLLEWFQDNKPKMLSDIKHFTKRGQIEIMTGGFYEPILPVIPRNDALGQIQMLSDFIKRHFQYQPKGAWIAERIWEPNMPSLLNEAGIRYIVLDDSHLKYAGLSQKQMHGYYMTEDNARTIAVFPSDKKLRYLIPFGQPQQVIDYLRSVCDMQDGTAAVYGDDAEKFGEWPGTHEWVYEKRWLYNFFLALKQNSSWIKTVHISEYLENSEPLGGVYLPTASYQEMDEWALPADAAEELEGITEEIKSDGREQEFQPFLRGGFWRNFLTKYPEANQMHKKMLRVSEKIERLTVNPKSDGSATRNPKQILSSKLQTPNSKLEQARAELYKGQCNCAYWHGVFGGLYLYHLRNAVYSHLIKAEAFVDEIVKGAKGWIDCEVADFDSDGYDEAIVSSPALSIFFDADEGGSIVEFDLKSKAVNIVNALARRKEAYHAELLKQAEQAKVGKEPQSIHQRKFENLSLKDGISYDWYRRACLLDHFLGPTTTIENFSRCQYEELGDFVNQPFKIKAAKNGVALTRDGQVSGGALCVKKEFQIKKDSADIKIAYQIKNTSEETMELWFGSEFNFSLTNDDVFEQLFSEEKLLLKDTIAGLGIHLAFSRPADIWRFPVKTISQSESDIEENYQSSAILPNWKFQLSPHQRWDVEISLAIL